MHIQISITRAKVGNLALQIMKEAEEEEEEERGGVVGVVHLHHYVLHGRFIQAFASGTVPFACTNSV